jgi:hypothetical protein
MKSLVAKYSKLVDYKVADATAASTYYIAEIYFNFNRSLLESERPKKLSALELEEFNLMLEEQAYPFEEKAITVHEKNVELLTAGIYSPWIDRSIEKLAGLLPARYAKLEESTNYVTNLHVFRYASQNQPFSPQETGTDADISSQAEKQIDPVAENSESTGKISVVGLISGDTTETVAATNISPTGKITGNHSQFVDASEKQNLPVREGSAASDTFGDQDVDATEQQRRKYEI